MSDISDADEEARWIDVQTAARILDMPERTVRHHCAVGELPARKYGRAWRVRKSAVEPDRAAVHA
jgi:excisionase family DNA binding protein